MSKSKENLQKKNLKKSTKTKTSKDIILAPKVEIVDEENNTKIPNGVMITFVESYIIYDGHSSIRDF